MDKQGLINMIDHKIDKLREAKKMVGPKKSIALFPKYFKLLCDEIKYLRKEVSKMDKQIKKIQKDTRKLEKEEIALLKADKKQDKIVEVGKKAVKEKKSK